MLISDRAALTRAALRPALLGSPLASRGSDPANASSLHAIVHAAAIKQSSSLAHWVYSPTLFAARAASRGQASGLDPPPAPRCPRHPLFADALVLPS